MFFPVKNTHYFSTQKEGSVNPFMKVVCCLSPVTYKRTNPSTAYQGLSAGEMQNLLMRLCFGEGILGGTKPHPALQIFFLRSFQEVDLSQERLSREKGQGLGGRRKQNVLERKEDKISFVVIRKCQNKDDAASSVS